MNQNLIRTCVACRRKKNKYQLYRLVVDKGRMIFDEAYKLPGRGYYICRSLECVESLRKSRSVRNIFKGIIREGDDKIYEEILREITKREKYGRR